jgi:hypothetical protein
MALTANATASTAVDYSRPQAGPLPSKQGEIGYRGNVDGRDLERGNDEGDSRSIIAPLPPRHPADRDAANETEANTDVPLTPAIAASASDASQDSSSTHSKGKRSIIKFFTAKQQKIPSYGGIRLTTLLLSIIQIIFIGGTVAGWILTVDHINHKSNNSDDPNTQNGANLQIGSAIIFIHVMFGVGLVGQLIFFERRLFRLRAERYAYLHPGETLPTSRRPSNASMGITPWNRPPLPTYAASLTQSGHGTGDVEDNIIAVPPPPAYGQTRNSRLLLTGYLRNSLRAQRPISEHSQTSQRDDDRPLSYANHDEQWMEMQDAERARVLEEALSALEAGTTPTASSAVTRR